MATPLPLTATADQFTAQSFPNSLLLTTDSFNSLLAVERIFPLLIFDKFQTADRFTADVSQIGYSLLWIIYIHKEWLKLSFRF